MKEFLKQFLRYFLAFLCLIIAFNAALYAVCSFPSELMKDNILESAEIIYEQGDYWYIGLCAGVENATDGLIVNEIYSIDSEDPLTSYMLVRKNYKKGLTKAELPDEEGTLQSYADNLYDDSGKPMVDEMAPKYLSSGEFVYSNYKISKELYNFVHDEVTISQSYSRYYHGYLVLFRPLFLLFNVSGVRTLMLISMIVLLGITAFLLYKKIGLRFCVVFCSTLFIFGYTVLALSLQQQPMFLALMISLIILLINIEKFDKKQFAFFLFINGCITNYLDFLTTPVLSLALPLLVFYAYNLEHDNKFDLKIDKFWEILLELIKFGLIWSIGYGLTWISKFILIDILYHRDGVSSGFSQILFRIGGDMTNIDLIWEYSYWPHIKRMLYLVNAIPILSLIIFGKSKLYWPNKKEFKHNLCLFLIASIPLAWMIILVNHTAFHYSLFSYRNFMVIIMVFYYVISLDKKIETKKAKKKG